ncbi:hypothetical protein P8452_54106 [Trifolium repens]|nr:hypothetical protein P8452_54106 [Trifolium repens]
MNVKSLFEDSELSGMDHVMSDQTVSLNEDNMVTPVNLKANIAVDLLLLRAAVLFDDYCSVEMSNQTIEIEFTLLKVELLS